MAEGNPIKAGFGAKADRYTQFGIHPKMKNPGGYIGYAYSKDAMDVAHLGPGKYDWAKTSMGIENHSTNWALQASPTVRRRTNGYKSEFDRQRRLGPGSYEFNDWMAEDAKTRVHSKRGLLDALAPRFKNAAAESTPGPGCYGEEGNPWFAIEQRSRDGFCRVGQMDSKSSGERTLPVASSDLGPGTYNIKSISEEIIAKQTGKRGPYDIFSGNRSKPLTTGHLAHYPSHDLGPGQYTFPSGIEEFQHDRYKKKHGEFRKVDRFLKKPLERVFWMKPGDCPRDSEAPSSERASTEGNMTRFHPGPAFYDPIDPNMSHTSPNLSPPAFLSSSQRNDRRAFIFFTGAHNPVGPGRYDVHKGDANHYVNGHESVFKSESRRNDPKYETTLKERLRARDGPSSLYASLPDLTSGFGAKKAVSMAS